MSPRPPLLHGILLVLSGLLCLGGRLMAWGPHPEITQAALDTLGPDDPLGRILGTDLRRLTQYVWMADQRQQLLVKQDEVFYTDDYLLFPAAARHYDHLCPEVKQTYVPYFRRALQALRTESPRNAARWVGSLLHFTTDTGSPPHAAEIRGPVHSSMENWVQGPLIHIPGYQPRLLGGTDAEAEAAFLTRMDGLIAFCKERALRCRADVEGGRRELVEPVVLEAALETARVTADLLHTLGVLAGTQSGTAMLSGRALPPPQLQGHLSRLPVKIILKGTLCSTLADEDGRFSFRHLPPGRYVLIASAPGAVSPDVSVDLTSATSVTLPDLALTKPVVTGNLVRNPSFTQRWVSPDLPDHWSQPKRPGKLLTGKPVSEWTGEWIPLQKDVSYRLSAKWQSPAPSPDDSVEIFLRARARQDHAAPITEIAAIRAKAPEAALTASQDTTWVQVCVRSPGPPETALALVSLAPVAVP